MTNPRRECDRTDRGTDARRAGGPHPAADRSRPRRDRGRRRVWGQRLPLHPTSVGQPVMIGTTNLTLDWIDLERTAEALIDELGPDRARELAAQIEAELRRRDVAEAQRDYLRRHPLPAAAS